MMRRRKFSSTIKSFLTYSKSERNGTILLTALLLMLIVASFIYRPISSSSITNRETYERIDSFFRSAQYVEPDVDINSKRNVLSEELPLSKDAKLFKFNPNTISIDSLIDLGLSPKQAKVVINYRNKGGQFRSSDDFSKIHVIDSSTYQRLKPWIVIPLATIASTDTLKVTDKATVVELNSADTISLTKLKGIGRSFARRIVTYRDLLGGFYSVNQLYEVYGLSPDVVNTFKPNIWVDSSVIRRININLIGYDELKEHPYLTDYQAKSIIYYRSKQGNIARLNELVENKILPQERYQKIAPYLTVK
jgi:DNA uptake protein ComE-like DNA-binding protein